MTESAARRTAKPDASDLPKDGRQCARNGGADERFCELLDHGLSSSSNRFSVVALFDAHYQILLGHGSGLIGFATRVMGRRSEPAGPSHERQILPGHRACARKSSLTIPMVPGVWYGSCLNGKCANCRLSQRKGSPHQCVPKIVPMLGRLGANQRESGFRKLLVRLVIDSVNSAAPCQKGF
jgi:hypothetical protein